MLSDCQTKYYQKLRTCDVQTQNITTNIINAENIITNNLTVCNDILDCFGNPVLRNCPSDCFIVDNRGIIPYCDTIYQTIQEAVNAICVSGLASGKICVAPSDYIENVLIPSSCTTQILIQGANNNNETTLVASRLLGTMTIERPVTLENLDIEGGLASAIILNATSNTFSPYLCILNSARNSVNTTGTLVLNNPTLVNAVTRLDNSRVTNSPNQRAVSVLGRSGFITTGDTNINGDLLNSSTIVDVDGLLLVNSSVGLNGRVIMNSATCGIRLQDVRFTNSTIRPL